MSEIHRCAPEIRLQILDFCRDKSRRKTEIVYLLNLNFIRATKFIDELISMGLLEVQETDAERLYATTQGGITAAGMARASGIVCGEATS